MRHADPRHPRIEGYRHLRDRYGEGALADALLAKWVNDPDGDHKWVELWDDVHAGRRLRHAGRGPVRLPRRVLKRLALLWYVSNGRTLRAAAAELGVPHETAKGELRELRQELGLSGVSQDCLVAYAIREGLIP